MAFITQAGGNGVDYSVNPSAIPASGLVLLQTIALRIQRCAIEIQNQSTSQVQLVFDDGQGGTATSFMLAAASIAGGAGQSYVSQNCKARVRIYGAAGAQVSAREH